jgi:methylenetetrahydromethanopterin dehydrogenase
MYILWMDMITVTFVKLGYIGTTTLVDALLDERSSRQDLKTRVISSGVRMDDEEAEYIANLAKTVESDLYVVISPNAALSGPKKARNILKEAGKPIIIISDEPSRKSLRNMDEENMGYIVIYGDPMISAKTVFLDAVEMAIFNADVLKVLAVTGALRLVHTTIDNVIEQIKNGVKPELPKLVINKEKALEASDIVNPYAYGKAMAAYEMARRVASLSSEGVFKISGRNEAVPVLSAAHELLRQAAKLADEAREIEKANDTAVRVAHFRNGSLRRKIGLYDKYE